VLKNNDDKKIKIGKLGEIFFKKGFYIYVGSAMKNLQARLNRHKRKRKNLFWHIDYLIEKTELIQVIPIRSSIRNECKLAERMKNITDDFIYGFGVSDCNCTSHLFYVDEYPLEKIDFINTVIDFRTPSVISR
ncbi:MAG: GIY-YIG nuclease family protein, partial [Syntrophorhabdaceae bacterium]|nr:GIY-YIG nuclease family protein [Syntrophorhabdaceae bacterium]